MPGAPLIQLKVRFRERLRQRSTEVEATWQTIDATGRNRFMTDQETSTKKLAMKYLELGGTLDDNIADVRKWDDEPAEADEFWKTQIEPLEDARLREVETHLPTINSD
jgi:hypothetical protein